MDVFYYLGVTDEVTTLRANGVIREDNEVYLVGHFINSMNSDNNPNYDDTTIVARIHQDIENEELFYICEVAVHLDDMLIEDLTPKIEYYLGNGEVHESATAMGEDVLAFKGSMVSGDEVNERLSLDLKPYQKFALWNKITHEVQTPNF